MPTSDSYWVTIPITVAVIIPIQDHSRHQNGAHQSTAVSPLLLWPNLEADGTVLYFSRLLGYIPDVNSLSLVKIGQILSEI